MDSKSITSSCCFPNLSPRKSHSLILTSTFVPAPPLLVFLGDENLTHLLTFSPQLSPVQGNEDPRGDSSNRLRRQSTLYTIAELVQQVSEGQVLWGSEERFIHSPRETCERSVEAASPNTASGF